MTPLSLLAAQKVVAHLTTGATPGDDLTNLISAAGVQLGLSVPSIPVSQIVLSSASADLDDRNIQLTYPRICVYASGFRNTQIEKFRSFSGTVTVIAEIWSSGDLVTDSDNWIHIYTASVSQLLEQSAGDWGDGLFYSGAYDVQFTSPRPGGLGFVQSAKLSLSLGVSVS